jgi:hypothetical protein
LGEKNNSNNKQKRLQRGQKQFLSGMTTRKATAKAKGNGNSRFLDAELALGKG